MIASSEVWDCALVGSVARFGSMVLAVHDASDVFLEVGKLTKYSGLVVIPSVSFIMFAISWFVLRLVIFPFVLIRSSRYVLFHLLMAATRFLFLMFGLCSFCSLESPQYFRKLLTGGTTLYVVFNTLLLTLQVMHVYWGALIWRMVMKQIQDRGQVSDDVRSGNLLTTCFSLWPYLLCLMLPTRFLILKMRPPKYRSLQIQILILIRSRLKTGAATMKAKANETDGNSYRR